MLKKQKAEDLIKIPGEIRGLALKNYGRYILREEGEQGLKMVEKEMLNLGCPIKYLKMKAMAFYPLWWSAATFVVLRKLFNYDEQKFEEMGRFCFKFPDIIRIWSKYLISIDAAAKSGPKMYRMYFTVGELTVSEYSKEKKYVVIRIKNYPVYPIDSPRIYCNYLIGYFSSILQAVTGKPTRGKETKCVYENHEYHEFLIKW